MAHVSADDAEDDGPMLDASILDDLALTDLSTPEMPLDDTTVPRVQQELFEAPEAKACTAPAEDEALDDDTDELPTVNDTPPAVLTVARPESPGESAPAFRPTTPFPDDAEGLQAMAGGPLFDMTALEGDDLPPVAMVTLIPTDEVPFPDDTSDEDPLAALEDSLVTLEPGHSLDRSAALAELAGGADVEDLEELEELEELEPRRPRLPARGSWQRTAMASLGAAAVLSAAFFWSQRADDVTVHDDALMVDHGPDRPPTRC